MEVSQCVGVRVAGGGGVTVCGCEGGGGVTVCGCDCDGICKVRRSDWTCTKMYTHCGLAPLAFPPGAGYGPSSSAAAQTTQSSQHQSCGSHS